MAPWEERPAVSTVIQAPRASPSKSAAPRSCKQDPPQRPHAEGQRGTTRHRLATPSARRRLCVARGGVLRRPSTHGWRVRGRCDGHSHGSRVSAAGPPAPGPRGCYVTEALSSPEGLRLVPLVPRHRNRGGTDTAGWGPSHAHGHYGAPQVRAGPPEPSHPLSARRRWRGQTAACWRRRRALRGHGTQTHVTLEGHPGRDPLHGLQHDHAAQAVLLLHPLQPHGDRDLLPAAAHDVHLWAGTGSHPPPPRLRACGHLQVLLACLTFWDLTKVQTRLLTLNLMI